jgi:hypothetical protein
LSPEIASGSLIFLPLSFGTAKVETFFYFANFIFLFFCLPFPASCSLFSPSFAGCKGSNLFLFCKLYFLFLFARLFPASQPLFSSSFAGCKGTTFILICQVKLSLFFRFFLVARFQKTNAFLLKAVTNVQRFWQPRKGFFQINSTIIITT